MFIRVCVCPCACVPPARINKKRNRTKSLNRSNHMPKNNFVITARHPTKTQQQGRMIEKVETMFITGTFPEAMLKSTQRSCTRKKFIIPTFNTRTRSRRAEEAPQHQGTCFSTGNQPGTAQFHIDSDETMSQLSS